MYILEFLSWWPKVRSTLWPPHYKPTENIRFVSHKPTETTQFFQDHGHSPHLWWSGCSWWSGVSGRSPEVKWGHMKSQYVCFSPISRDRMEIQTRKWFQTTWLVKPLRKMQIDVLGSGPDLTLTWPEVKFWNWHFNVKTFRYMSSWFDEANTMVSFLISYLSYQKSFKATWNVMEMEMQNISVTA